MTSPEQRLADALDLLADVQIVALYLGTMELAHYFIDTQHRDPHPIKHNVKAQTTAAGLYQDLLDRELVHHLPARDARKAERIAAELSLHDGVAAKRMAERIREQLRQNAAG